MGTQQDIHADEVVFYRLSTTETSKELRSGADGLTAADAAERLKDLGPNALDVKRREPWPVAYARQFRDLMIGLLLVSSLLSFYLGDARAGVILLVLVFFNTIIGFLQEYRAEKLIQSLEKLVVDVALVLRDGKLVEVPARDLVPGDMVRIEEGNSVPADLRIISEEELSTNDFALTGESQPTRKFTHPISAAIPLSARQNQCYMGTTVATGNGYGMVIATGMQTELGRIASLSSGTKRGQSPLQREMNNIATKLTKATVVLCAILLPIAINSGLEIKDALLFAIGLAASIIPQGLPAEINTALAQAAAKLARAKALVKKLSSVETLGATNVIATDKTGTLTKNQMTVEHVLIGRTGYDVGGSGYEPVGRITTSDGKPLTSAQLTEMELFFATAAMASNARVNPPDKGHAVWYCLGDPTEGAAVTLAAKAGLDPLDLDRQYPELREFPFDSARKRMSSLRAYGKGARKNIYVFVKGAPESVLEKCADIWDHGHVRGLAAADRKAITREEDLQAGQAMRNLGFAYRILPADTDVSKLTLEEVEQDLTWLGLASMIDPLREEVPAAMLAARDAHIKVSIITGDSAPTARAIALRARLADSAEELTIVPGDELAAMSDDKVAELAGRGGVIFSRVSPEDKLRIVSLLQDTGKVVAVTGDGINDAPALKKADIGVAMGKAGTDVAKQSAEIILLDDSFGTLVSAVQQGRTVFQNIRKATLSCFTSNAAELMVNIVSLAAVAAFHIPLAISIMHILAIDLIAELFPIAALGRDKADGDLMRQPPRDRRQHILNRFSVADLLWCGLLIGGLAFANYLIFFDRNNIDPAGLTGGTPIHLQAMTLTYLTIVLCQLANILMRRTSRGLFTRYQLHNRTLWLAMAFSFFCVANIIYNPWVAPYFRSAPLSLNDWLYALAAAAIFIAIRELQRHMSLHSREEVVALHLKEAGTTELKM